MVETNTIVKKDGTPLKIALIGGARAGKDTVALYLGAISDFQRIAFGDAMKHHLYEIFPDLKDLPKPRQAMIDFGQACRGIDPLVWVKALARESKKWKEFGYANLVITDVRQPNELEYCLDNGYTIVKIEVEPEIAVARALEGGEVLDPNNSMDKFAREFDGADFTISNNGTLLELYEKVDEVLREV